MRRGIPFPDNSRRQAQYVSHLYSEDCVKRSRYTCVSLFHLFAIALKHLRN